MKYLLAFCFFLLFLPKANAQNPAGNTSEPGYSFTLEEAINFAIDSSYATINARRDLAKALKQKWETTARGLPQIDAGVSYLNNLKQPVTLIPAEFTGGEPGTFLPVVFGTKQSVSAVATLNQLIFDGSYLVGLQAAKTFLDYSENALEKTKLEVRRGVINAYGSVLLSEELIAIFEKNKENLDQTLFETQKIFENGLTEEEDVEQLKITLLDIETQLNNARRSNQIARQMFNLALGIDVEVPVVLEESLNQLTQENISLNLLSSPLNLENNIDYKIVSNLNEQRALELKLEKSKALPRLSAFINYGTSGSANDFDFFKPELEWYQSSLLGLSLNIPIFSSGLRSAATQRAAIALEQAETQLEQTEQSIILNANSAKSTYQFAIENYENSRQNLELAMRVENKNQIKFTEGISSSFELRLAQTQLYTAQQQYFQAMLQVINSKAELETILNEPTN